MTHLPSIAELAAQYHAAMPDRIRRYLNDRGIPDYLIDRHLLGWNGTRITIPIRDREGVFLFFKLAKDPQDASDSPKMLAPPGSRAELYGWEHLRALPMRIIVCEGEFDRLVLEAHGFAAVTSTGGAGVFRREWAEALGTVPEVYLVFDRDEAGQEGALRVARLVKHARIVDLPLETGTGGDVTDYFVRLRRSADDFLGLLHRGWRPPDINPMPARVEVRGNSPINNAIADLKGRVPIEGIVGRYVRLQPSGRFLAGRCPFHDDRVPSLLVYPETKTFYCFGCREHGDAISFLMRAEKLDFHGALDALRQLAA